jgi:hypothetical protein
MTVHRARPRAKLRRLGAIFQIDTDRDPGHPGCLLSWCRSAEHRVRSVKTTQLLPILNRHQIAERRPVLLRSPQGNAIDHAPFLIITADALPPPDAMAEYDTVRIEEAQRFPNIAASSEEAANHGTLVEVSALDGNHEREAFPNILECVSISERVQKLDSMSEITELPAPFSTLQKDVASRSRGLGSSGFSSPIPLVK